MTRIMNSQARLNFFIKRVNKWIKNMTMIIWQKLLFQCAIKSAYQKWFSASMMVLHTIKSAKLWFCSSMMTLHTLHLTNQLFFGASILVLRPFCSANQLWFSVSMMVFCTIGSLYKSWFNDNFTSGSA